MMAQMELIHWECRGKIYKGKIVEDYLHLLDSSLKQVPGQISYSCASCGTIFVYDENGLVYTYKVGEVELDRIVASAPVDVAALAREISCEGRVM